MNGSAEAKLSDTVMSTASFEVYGMSLLQTVICQTAWQPVIKDMYLTELNGSVPGRQLRSMSDASSLRNYNSDLQFLSSA